MKKTISSICKSLAIMSVLLGSSLTDSADTVTEGFDGFKAGWNSSWTAWELTLPEGWDYSGAANYYAKGDTYKTAAPSIEVSDNNTSSYLITPTLKGDFSFYIRNYTKNYQASITAYACTFEGGTLTLGTELGSKTLTKTSSGVPDWEKVTFNTTHATRVALLISRAYFDDFTYTPSEDEGGGGGGGDTPEPQPDPVPVMVVTTTTVNFGSVTANATQDVTISNTGNAELTVAIASDNADFTVSKANVTVAAGATETFAITYQYQAEAYGPHTATITLTPNAGEVATIAASAYVRNPNAWTEDFSGNQLPVGWTAGEHWTFTDGVAHSSYDYYVSNDYLTTPALLVADGEVMTFKYKATGIYVDIKIQASKDGGEFTQVAKISKDAAMSDFEVYTLSGLAAGTYKFRFANDNYDLDDFEGFKLDADAPQMEFTAEDFVAGKVTETVSKTYTVSNSGTGTLTVNIVSDNEQFAVSPAQLEITNEAKQFTVSFTPQEGVYGKFQANITVTPTYNEAAAVTFKASAQVADPEQWTEDFSDNQLPEGWNIIGSVSKWSFADGEASATYEPGGWLVTPKLVVADGQAMTFQARSKQYGTDLIVQYQKDGGEWTEQQKHAYEGTTSYETFTIEGLEAGTYRFRFATENLALDNFEGFKLAPNSAVKETWWISYSFTYQTGGQEITDSDVEQMEIEFDGNDLSFNFPNPINGNTWMHGSKYIGEGPEAYIFPSGQYIGKYGSDDIYYCGSNGSGLADMVFYWDEEKSAYYNFEHVLLNISATTPNVLAYFSEVAITKEKPESTGISDVRRKTEDDRGDFYDLQGRKVANGQLKPGLYIVNGEKVMIK